MLARCDTSSETLSELVYTKGIQLPSLAPHLSFLLTLSVWLMMGRKRRASITQRTAFLTLNGNLHVRRGGGTSDNFNQLAGNDGLAGAVEENLVLADHLTSVLGSVL